jgi:hypothetical protein
MIHLEPAISAEALKRIEKHDGILADVIRINDKLATTHPEWTESSVEVRCICEHARDRLSELSSSAELQTAILDCWSRTVLWRDEIAPRLLQKLTL